MHGSPRLAFARTFGFKNHNSTKPKPLRNVMLICWYYFLFPAKPGTCHRDQFKCRTGSCISSVYVCDGVPDCSDHSDEDNCPNSNCNLNEIYCPANRQCLNRTLQCNGKKDCADYSDEAHCGSKLILSII